MKTALANSTIKVLILYAPPMNENLIVTLCVRVCVVCINVYDRRVVVWSIYAICKYNHTIVFKFIYRRYFRSFNLELSVDKSHIVPDLNIYTGVD